MCHLLIKNNASLDFLSGLRRTFRESGKCSYTFCIAGKMNNTIPKSQLAERNMKEVMMSRSAPHCWSACALCSAVVFMSASQTAEQKLSESTTRLEMVAPYQWDHLPYSFSGFGTSFTSIQSTVQECVLDNSLVAMSPAIKPGAQIKVAEALLALFSELHCCESCPYYTK